MLALAQFEAECCPECHFHPALTEDTSNHFAMQHRTCPVCAGLEQQNRVDHAAESAYEKALGKDVSPREPRPSDGRNLTVRLLTHQEAQERRAAATKSPKEVGGGNQA